MELYKHQYEALNKMHNGCILNGGVGSGKSRTALSYFFFKVLGGSIQTYVDEKIVINENRLPKIHKNLYIITTAMKRDKKDWEGELTPFLASLENIEIHIDSWNNIKKYVDVQGSFFIFDEQRVVGYGAWSKSFIKIAKKNQWILLSATPGDKWEDYIPVFIANGFYKNKTEFSRMHFVYSRFITNYPKIEGYMNEGRLYKLRNSLLIDMKFSRSTTQHHEYITCDYARHLYTSTMKNRINPFEKDEFGDVIPIQQASQLCYILRRICNGDVSRIAELRLLLLEHPKTIIFYNFDYELELIRECCTSIDIPYSEWNGHKHEPIGTGDRWVYIVQYTAGSEGWNCITTNSLIFYSQNYSYKIMKQAEGRIDRLNTPFKDLYYYHLISKSGIDNAIYKALKDKKDFNERGYFLNF